MIKLKTSYSTKVPGKQEYSSTGYYISIEAELPDALIANADKLREKIAGMFEEAKRNVEAQSNGKPENNYRNNGGNKGWENNNRDNGQKASEKQRSFIVSLARRRHGMDLRKLQELTGMPLEDLSKNDASRLISQLKESEGAPF